MDGPHGFDQCLDSGESVVGWLSTFAEEVHVHVFALISYKFSFFSMGDISAAYLHIRLYLHITFSFHCIVYIVQLSLPSFVCDKPVFLVL